MNEVQRVLGDALYLAVQQKLNGQELYIDDGKLIPKHRFDCINISLREHKLLVKELQEENQQLKLAAAESERLKQRAEFAEEELEIYGLLSEAKARSYKALRSLLNTGGLHGAALIASVKKQIRKLRQSDRYLFYDCTTYKLVPCDSTVRSN